MPMFIECDQAGKIIAAHSQKMYRTQIEVRDDDPGLFAYMNRNIVAQKLATVGLSTDDVTQSTTKPGKYCDRDDSGSIVSASDEPQRDGQERVPLASPELLRFLEGRPVSTMPPGYEAKFIGGATAWRVLRTSDNTAVASGLPSLAACAAAADRLVGARREY